MRLGPMYGIALVASVLIAARATPAQARAKQSPELSGEWRLDADKSQTPNPPEPSQAPPTGGARAVRPMLLPSTLRIDATQGAVRLADTTGIEVAEILLGSAAPPVNSSPPGVKHLTGKWRGSSLQATSGEPEGARVTETFSLKSKGRTLEIKPKVESSGEGPSFEFKRVYDRAAN
jgi:hypothetical protein